MNDIPDLFDRLQTARRGGGRATDVLASAQRQATRARRQRRAAGGALALALLAGTVVGIDALTDDTTTVDTSRGPVATDPGLPPTTADPARPPTEPEVAPTPEGSTPTTGDGDEIGAEGGGPPPADLVRPEPGHEITFDRIGDVRLGQTVPATEASLEPEWGCGSWPNDVDGHFPGPWGLAIATDDPGTVRLPILYVRGAGPHRTASGVGVGTSLASLERIYGDRLVVDRADGWESGTDGLTALYQDVAAVRDGSTALTFYLRGDVVETIKLSGADDWGDDEGCA